MEEDSSVSIKPVPIQSKTVFISNFHINLLKIHFCVLSFSIQMLNLSRLDTFLIFLINFLLILSTF